MGVVVFVVICTANGNVKSTLKAVVKHHYTAAVEALKNVKITVRGVFGENDDVHVCLQGLHALAERRAEARVVMRGNEVQTLVEKMREGGSQEAVDACKRQIPAALFVIEHARLIAVHIAKTAVHFVRSPHPRGLRVADRKGKRCRRADVVAEKNRSLGDFTEVDKVDLFAEEADKALVAAKPKRFLFHKRFLTLPRFTVYRKSIQKKTKLKRNCKQIVRLLTENGAECYTEYSNSRLLAAYERSFLWLKRKKLHN